MSPLLPFSRKRARPPSSGSSSTRCTSPRHFGNSLGLEIAANTRFGATAKSRSRDARWCWGSMYPTATTTTTSKTRAETAMSAIFMRSSRLGCSITSITARVGELLKAATDDGATPGRHRREDGAQPRRFEDRCIAHGRAPPRRENDRGTARAGACDEAQCDETLERFGHRRASDAQMRRESSGGDRPGLVKVRQDRGVARRQPMFGGSLALMARVARQIDLWKGDLHDADGLIDGHPAKVGRQPGVRQNERLTRHTARSLFVEFVGGVAVFGPIIPVGFNVATTTPHTNLHESRRMTL